LNVNGLANAEQVVLPEKGYRSAPNSPYDIVVSLSLAAIDVAYNRSMKYIPVSLIIGMTFLWCASPMRADDASKSAKAE
jgi:hypothetical protein